MTNKEAIELLNKALGCVQTDPRNCGKCKECKNYATKEDGIEALSMAIAALEKAETNCPEIPDSCNAETVEAIPTAWIEAEIKYLKALDFEFASLSAGQIEAMLKKWREEQNDKRESNHTC